MMKQVRQMQSKMEEMQAEMEAMERDMRNRFLVSLVFTIPIVLWSMVGTKLLGTELATPFGLDRDVWQLLLSLPVVLYASSIFFTGAVAALRNRTLDMMVLVAVAVGIAAEGGVDIAAIAVSAGLAFAFVAVFAFGGTAVMRRRPQILHAPAFSASPLLPAVILCLGIAALAAGADLPG